MPTSLSRIIQDRFEEENRVLKAQNAIMRAALLRVLESYGDDVPAPLGVEEMLLDYVSDELPAAKNFLKTVIEPCRKAIKD